MTNEQKTVPGSSALTDEQREQLQDLFGLRYHVIQSGDPEHGNRKERRRARYGGREQ